MSNSNKQRVLIPIMSKNQPSLALDYYLEHLKGTNDQLLIVHCVKTKHQGPPFASPEFLGVPQMPSNEKIAKCKELCAQVVASAKEQGMECESYIFYHSKREKALVNAIRHLKPHTAVVDGRCSASVKKRLLKASLPATYIAFFNNS
ncbi:universal stress protein [Clonorchis sinensis]|uniref:Universal stress protein n=1 Tax=Clonorchis sinensis TaxID=79923 RepID=H2KUS0_CLOSI|nr:universal stress protein [Clonorchis sinensis]